MNDPNLDASVRSHRAKHGKHESGAGSSIYECQETPALDDCQVRGLLRNIMAGRITGECSENGAKNDELTVLSELGRLRLLTMGPKPSQGCSYRLGTSGCEVLPNN